MKLLNPPAFDDKKSHPPMWYGGPGYYFVKQWGGGQKHSGPCGRRKTKQFNILRKAIAAKGGRK